MLILGKFLDLYSKSLHSLAYKHIAWLIFSKYVLKLSKWFHKLKCFQDFKTGFWSYLKLNMFLQNLEKGTNGQNHED